MYRKLLIAFAVLVALSALANAAPKAANETDGCLQYGKPVTLTGTVIVRRVDFGPDEPAWWSGSFPLLVLDHSICATDDEEPENMEWALHLLDVCSRTWPTMSRVRVTGELFHANTVHHRSKVLVSVKQIQRLDGKMPSCKKENS
jgi:hypothetical protein